MRFLTNFMKSKKNFAPTEPTQALPLAAGEDDCACGAEEAAAAEEATTWRPGFEPATMAMRARGATTALTRVIID